MIFFKHQLHVSDIVGQGEVFLCNDLLLLLNMWVGLIRDFVALFVDVPY